VFITEATFGLPVFRHPPDSHEIEKLLHSMRLFPESCHLVGVYALGKCQRVIALLRAAGYDEPIFLHGALIGLTELYRQLGVELGPTLPCTDLKPDAFRGRIVLAPPSALGDRWTRRLPDPVSALASGWMRVKQRAKARGVELPLVISDHADWDELTATLDDVGAEEIWVTHGREEALVHYAGTRGLRARALALTGFGDEAEE
jgi:putative mRNA 3-end processing factor